MSLSSALIGALALCSAVAHAGEAKEQAQVQVQQASTATNAHQSKSMNQLGQAHQAASDHVLAYFAPSDWKDMVFSYVPPKEEEEAEGATAADTKDGNDHTRQLRQRPRNPTYRPSNNAVGYIILDIYNDHKANGVMDPMCTDGNQISQTGISTGSCFAARKYHGDTIVGSWKIGVVVASSGRNHIHVESYESSDCTGTVRRTSNNLSRIHFIEGESVPASSDVRSRRNWGGDDDVDGSFRFTCLKYHYYRGYSAPTLASCIADGHFVGHSVTTDCANDRYVFYTVVPGNWGACNEWGEKRVCTATQILDESYGTYDAVNDVWTGDPTCAGTAAYDEATTLGCRGFTPAVSGDPPLATAVDDDDDYKGGPEVTYYTDDNLGWNVTGNANYDPWFNTIFNRSPEGSTIQGSTKYVFQDCWLGTRTGCGPPQT